MREINVETIEIQISLQIVMRRIRGKSILILYQYSSRNYKINIDIIDIHYHFRKIENTKLLYCSKKEQKEIEFSFNVSSIFISLH